MGKLLEMWKGGELTTSVVCDTGYLGVSMGNYILEEEGGELDDFIEDETKVVE